MAGVYVQKCMDRVGRQIGAVRDSDQIRSAGQCCTEAQTSTSTSTMTMTEHDGRRPTASNIDVRVESKNRKYLPVGVTV